MYSVLKIKHLKVDSTLIYIILYKRTIIRIFVCSQQTIIIRHQ